MEARFIEVIAIVKRVVIAGLLALMLGLVVIATLELAVTIFYHLLDPVEAGLALDLTELIELFGFFLLILIGIELLETIQIFLEDGVVHAEFVILAGLIAAARKVITLDLQKNDAATLAALAALIVSLGAAYALTRWAGRASPRT